MRLKLEMSDITGLFELLWIGARGEWKLEGVDTKCDAK